MDKSKKTHGYHTHLQKINIRNNENMYEIQVYIKIITIELAKNFDRLKQAAKSQHLLNPIKTITAELRIRLDGKQHHSGGNAHCAVDNLGYHLIICHKYLVILFQ
jgi:hypothetical protein